MIFVNTYQLRVLEPPCTLITYCLLKENDTKNQNRHPRTTFLQF